MFVAILAANSLYAQETVVDVPRAHILDKGKVHGELDGTVRPASRAGGQFSLEQRIGSRLTLTTEWYTGIHAAGYVNPGAIIKVTSKLTGYSAYQIGNAGITKGNYQFPWELGYNFN